MLMQAHICLRSRSLRQIIKKSGNGIYIVFVLQKAITIYYEYLFPIYYALTLFPSIFSTSLQNCIRMLLALKRNRPTFRMRENVPTSLQQKRYCGKNMQVQFQLRSYILEPFSLPAERRYSLTQSIRTVTKYEATKNTHITIYTIRCTMYNFQKCSETRQKHTKIVGSAQYLSKQIFWGIFSLIFAKI